MLVRDTSPMVAGGDLAQLVTGNTAFALDLYEAIAGSDENLFYSPYSISLALALTSPAQAGEKGGFELGIANSVWGQEGHEFFAAYFDTLTGNYGGEVRQVDYRGQPEAARKRINDWVYEETNGRIEDLVPHQAINIRTRLVLANAVFFKAGWQTPFEQRATSRAPFYGLDGDESRVEMMRQTVSFGYARGDSYRLKGSRQDADPQSPDCPEDL